MCLSQAKTWIISNVISGGLYFWVEMRGDWSFCWCWWNWWPPHFIIWTEVRFPRVSIFVRLNLFLFLRWICVAVWNVADFYSNTTNIVISWWFHGPSFQPVLAKKKSIKYIMKLGIFPTTTTTGDDDDFNIFFRKSFTKLNSHIWYQKKKFI